ncbi:hypothetical protein TA3x_001995 [Tundrisphaera sp. TA3]|uniref:hypothetical protein n=1 Tax=Tundrisphaera sp. TA3 TaxID=3435775 RepID=UPI003EBC5E5A
MGNLRSQGRKSRQRRGTAATWPSWTDDYRYFPTQEDDDRVASEAQYEGPTDEVLEQQANEAAELDRLSRGVRFF